MMKYLEHARSHTTVLQDSCGLRLEMEFLHGQRLSSEELVHISTEFDFVLRCNLNEVTDTL